MKLRCFYMRHKETCLATHNNKLWWHWSLGLLIDQRTERFFEDATSHCCRTVRCRCKNKITACNFFANEETRLVCYILKSFFVGLGQALEPRLILLDSWISWFKSLEPSCLPKSSKHYSVSSSDEYSQKAHSKIQSTEFLVCHKLWARRGQSIQAEA